MSHLCSIICVAYNHARFAEQGLQSLFNQTYRDLEIIVLDDGSPDETADVLRKKLSESPFPSKLIEQKNTGNLPRNFNRAISESSGDFLSFLSLDDLFVADCVQKKMEWMISDENLVFAADTGFREINAKGQFTSDLQLMPAAHLTNRTASGLLDIEYREMHSFFIQSQVFRRRDVEAVSAFDDSMTGDDIILRTKLFQYLLAHPEKKFKLGNSETLVYRKHSSNLHLRSSRQVKIVVEWKERFFPDRPFPPNFFGWLGHSFKNCLDNNRHDELAELLSYHPVISEYFEVFQRKYHRKKLGWRRFFPRISRAK